VNSPNIAQIGHYLLYEATVFVSAEIFPSNAHGVYGLRLWCSTVKLSEACHLRAVTIKLLNRNLKYILNTKIKERTHDTDKMDIKGMKRRCGARVVGNDEQLDDKSY